MSDRAQTSSITSVTEEEDSSVGWESDTTESSPSAITSTTTDYMTDDKLTPGLGNISISKAVDDPGLSPGKHKKPCYVDLSRQEKGAGEMKPPAVPAFPYGSNPLPLHRNRNNNHQNPKKRQNYSDNNVVSASESTFDSDLSESTSSSADRKEDTTLTKDNVKCDRSSNEGNDDHSPLLKSNDVSCSQSQSSERPFYPDMGTGSWYQARCFDSYWKNYHFVMDWYQQHLRTVQRLAEGDGSGVSGAAAHSTGQIRRQGNSRRARKIRGSKRARRRRLTKEHQRASTTASAATETVDSESSGGEMEMEITDEMVEFFTASFKHRIERDNQKKNEEKDEEENHVNIEQVAVGHQAPSVSAPLEQPGVRRTAELRLLYGSGAPMIHGMETALQLNFDRVTDRNQPKLWPNMPLKMCFG